MTMWLPNLQGRRRPVYRAIADAIDEDVQNGALKAGARLPPHRDLADHLGVTVTTITRAYTEASRRGLISGHVGRGTFIGSQGLTADPEHVVLTAGAQHALACAVAATLKPGETLLVEELTYAGVRLLGRHSHVKV